MDLLCSFLAMCMIALISLQSISNAAGESKKALGDFELEKNAVMLLDSMVKNRNEENPALGSAQYNPDKHRVEENRIDVALLKQANPLVAKNVFLKELSLKFQDGAEKELLETGIGKNCLGIERIVFAEGKKALLLGVVCVE